MGYVYLLCDGEKFKIGMTKNKIEKSEAVRINDKNFHPN